LTLGSERPLGYFIRHAAPAPAWRFHVIACSLSRPASGWAPPREYAGGTRRAPIDLSPFLRQRNAVTDIYQPLVGNHNAFTVVDTVTSPAEADLDRSVASLTARKPCAHSPTQHSLHLKTTNRHWGCRCRLSGSRSERISSASGMATFTMASIRVTATSFTTPASPVRAGLVRLRRCRLNASPRGRRCGSAMTWVLGTAGIWRWRERGPGSAKGATAC